ncbi:MAG TPA: respiratory nitrate reductase subunit gamma [Nitrospirota bacterium]|nr:respiratory nitrate reductase subunit gamma [Nitrospirota bacterium]
MAQIELIDFPKPWLLFYAAMTLSLLYMAFAFFRKWQGWSRGFSEPVSEERDFRRAVKIWLAEVLLHRQLYALSFSRWLIHILIFYGFIGLAVLPGVAFVLRSSGYLAISDTFPRFYIHPQGYVMMKVWGDSFGLMLLLGLVLAGIRRIVQREAKQSSNQMDALLLALLLSVALSGFALEGLRCSLVPAEIARYSYVARLFTPREAHALVQLQPWLTACWTVHFLLVATLLGYLPHSKLMHSLLAPVIIAVNAAEEHTREDLYWPEMKKYRATRSPRD